MMIPQLPAKTTFIYLIKLV